MYEEDEVEIPIYLITGFLESGKTSFINFTVAQDYFQIDGPTLLITTEEGEVEYDEKELLKHNTVLEIVEGPEQFTLDYLKKLNRKYRPERIILEYNPLWSVKKARRNGAAARLGHCTGDCNRRCKLLPDLYAEYEICFHGDGKKCGYGYVQPLSSGRSASGIPPQHQSSQSGMRRSV